MAYPDKRADEWKHAVRRSAALSLPADWEPITEACSVEITFHMPRPLYHHVAGKSDRPLKANAPTFHTKKPDADNLAKAVLDALTAWPKGEPALVFSDDCVVASLRVDKRYGASPGATIRITPLTEANAPERITLSS